jgi:hypothetical protein
LLDELLDSFEWIQLCHHNEVVDLINSRVVTDKWIAKSHDESHTLALLLNKGLEMNQPFSVVDHKLVQVDNAETESSILQVILMLFTRNEPWCIWLRVGQCLKEVEELFDLLLPW